MFINKKIAAVFTVVAMMASSVMAMSVAHAAEVPTVTIDSVAQSELNVNSYMDAGIKFTLSGLEKNVDTFAMKIEIPGDILMGEKVEGRNFVKVPLTTTDNVDTVLGGPSGSFFNTVKPNQKALSSSDTTTGLYKFYYFWVTPSGTSTYMKNGDILEMDYYFADGKTVADLPVGTFRVTDLKLIYNGESDPIETVNVVNNVEVKGGDAEITPVITPAEGQSEYEAAAAFTGYADATKVGSYTGDDNADDKATAFKATVSGTSSTGDVVWKVTDGTTTKYHKMSTGAAFAGKGSAIVGLAVEGLADGTASVAFLK